jgi:demethoxyubiquinone hydroxylase (CLK1/Coq7/Cat5 family)
MQNQAIDSIGLEELKAANEADALNSLLRGEVAATEAYDVVLPKFANRPQVIELQRIRDEHTEAAAILRERVRHFGGDPAEGSGIWGTLASAFTSTAKVLGPETALGALIQGEQFGVGRYESTLSDPRVDGQDKELIRYRLLPRCRQHVERLNSLVDRLQA